MKRLLIATTAVLTLAAPAIAASSRDSVAGSLKVTHPSGLFQDVAVSAHSGPAGESPTGHVDVSFDLGRGHNGEVKGKVMCLRVSGDQAWVVALLDEPFNGKTHVTLIIYDNGNPATGHSPDAAAFGFTSSPTADCANDARRLGGGESETRGNLRVHDAT
jgi:hypothetical protein